MRFGSVCSGIEAASVAWNPLGWGAAWLSEIEPFPCAVLAQHYPGVPNLGDMTLLPDLIRAGQVEAPDILCGGTPCQSFSVAGLRKSLDDARGNLSLTFCEIADAIDHVRGMRGQQPSIIFWENVPGVLSTKDNAFGCFLAGLAGEDCELKPPGKRWADAGCVFGPQRAIAWRVLDAQYFGLAQRRRRVFVVASARAGFDPAAVLFEFDGVRRDTAPSREARQTAPTIPARSSGGGGLGTDFDCDSGTICVATGQAGAESGADMAPTLNCNHEAPYVAHSLRGEGFDASEDGTGRGTPLVPHVVGALACNTGPNGHDAGNFACNQAVDAGHILPVVFHPIQDPISSTDGTTHAIGCGSSGGQASVAVAYGIRTANTSSNGWGIQEEVTHTLDQAMGVAVAFQPGNLTRGAGSAPSTDVFPTLKSDRRRGLSDQQPHVLTAMAVRRLTPEECEALQGFPRGYTAIPWRGKPAEYCTDGPRYKALGNSWAVPVVRWIGERIAAVEQINLERRTA